MVGMMEKLAKQLANPSEFFNSARAEDWKPAFAFFLWATLFISIVTSILNYFWHGKYRHFFVLSSTNLGI